MAGPSARRRRKTRQQRQTKDVNTRALAKLSSIPAADGTCYFDRLPRELRDMIYEAAYTRDGEVSIDHDLKSRFWDTGSPHHDMAHFLVSKRWQTEALSAYFRQNTFYLMTADDLAHCLTLGGSCFSKNVRALHVGLDCLPPEDIITKSFDGFRDRVPGYGVSPWNFTRIAGTLSQCTQLKTLSVDIKKYIYEWNWNTGSHNSDQGAMRASKKYEPFMAYIDRQFTGLLADLKHIRGLESFTMRIGDLDCYEMLIENINQEELQQHLRDLEKQVMTEATKPRERRMA